MVNHDIITIGASAGGVEALMRLTASLPEDLPASLFIVQHLSATRPSFLAEILDRASPLQVSMATDQQRIEPRRVYIGRSPAGDRHRDPRTPDEPEPGS